MFFILSAINAGFVFYMYSKIEGFKDKIQADLRTVVNSAKAVQNFTDQVDKLSPEQAKKQLMVTLMMLREYFADTNK